ncbi:MAG: preprotein translocase subunit SecG, partial [Kiritimatiellae bacterium]|nr:preprotein translocase subunit SecG [Kiritimatiellia bacterium]
MAILTGILQFVLVIVCLLLVGVILLQRNKGAGAGVTFGGGEAVFGADMGNVLTRSTIVLGFLFVA